jgi:hypothetical protein
MRYELQHLRKDQTHYLRNAIEQGTVRATLILEGTNMATIEVDFAKVDDFNLRRYRTNAKRGLIKATLVIEQNEDVLAPVPADKQVKRVVGKRKTAAATPAATPEPAAPAAPAPAAPGKRTK